MESSYLKEYGGEYEKLMINRINQYCITPIVPIYFNDMEYMLPELTASTWCNELTHYEGENLRGNVDADNRFEYCFGYNYRYIVIYDKKMRYLIHFKIPQYGENRSETLSYQLCRQYNVLSFMGMHIEDNIDITGNFFEIAYMDILSGEGSAVIDASRMKLTYEAKRQIEQSVVDAVSYAKE